jgi:hypothetical protein
VPRTGFDIRVDWRSFGSAQVAVFQRSLLVCLCDRGRFEQNLAASDPYLVVVGTTESGSFPALAGAGSLVSTIRAEPCECRDVDGRLPRWSAGISGGNAAVCKVGGGGSPWAFLDVLNWSGAQCFDGTGIIQQPTGLTAFISSILKKV